ncbi:Na+/H+ antiporter subunit E [Fredinandcohnia quinoae]|uniref:Na+/H+ antiporter subunit E n=1 Tax=Fredinandcohnia quinoae TaxID=2918902 RepID=A0AAW5E6H7_9BACI|nr:Na+/H+ antiporter subunit E [Fredinandcohnia sp. SECRCQ15]MCH1625507.1 Na+/H+ antiporter subunit E [Fredinandcohnia sp. SECRCQ15]
MALQLLLNVFIAFTWMFLGNSYDFGSFFGGYLIGLLLIFTLRRYFSTRFYILNVWAVIKLMLIFIRELVLSNYAIFKVIIKPKLDIKPGIFALPTELKKDWEITVLANLITLTPGTLVVDISDDRKILYIHAMDISDVDEAIDSIKNSFEKAIMEVSR